jgi:hypothetical protein
LRLIPFTLDPGSSAKVVCRFSLGMFSLRKNQL